MDSKREKERKNILLNKVQEQIEQVSIEIEKLQQDLNFYRRLYQELRRDYSHYRSDNEESIDLSIEFRKYQPTLIYTSKNHKNKRKTRKRKHLRRQKPGT